MGLCEEINMFTVDGLQQNMFIIEAKNIPDDKIDTVENSVRNILKDIVKNGIDKKALVASFNSFEFKQRERDFGSYPTGIIFAMSALETWLYGGDPLKNLEYDNTFKSLREKIDLGYFEQIINDVILNETHTATVYIPIPPARGGTGKVTMNLQERFVELDAITDYGEKLTTGTMVQVISVTDKNEVIVRPMK
jgi:Zn-dependent M16 (insulinase) family peptidase